MTILQPKRRFFRSWESTEWFEKAHIWRVYCDGSWNGLDRRSLCGKRARSQELTDSRAPHCKTCERALHS